MITAEKIGQCVKCPLGMYQPMKGQFNCRPCPRGHVTAEKGALEFSKCIFGKVYEIVMIVMIVNNLSTKTHKFINIF